ncbi:MAG: hypothetical protein CYPHOPRED_004192 [Cyphobasidiales sp. Tagirdzhanova-0007]|nr:MAG: hypothetical protein CYPHOPRED_004192 [Cyphobasidiales sp. Tagirdzhanova-0007]
MKLSTFFAFLPLVAATPFLKARDGPGSEAVPTLKLVATLRTSTSYIAADPIPVPGGVRYVGSVNQGTLSGAINGNINGGVFYPAEYSNGSFIVANVVVYGKTSDGDAFLIQSSGVGATGATQYSYESFEIAGSLNTTFLFGAVSYTPNSDGGADLESYIMQAMRADLEFAISTHTWDVGLAQSRLDSLSRYTGFGEFATMRATLTIATGPILIPGGTMVAGAFSNNGTITGKINGTIEGGTGAPATYDNGTVLIPNISLYGKTDEGFDFYMSEAGVGSPGQTATDFGYEASVED